MSTKIVWLLLGAGALVLAGRAYSFLREARDLRQMIPDAAGNYDIDGVSYDAQERTVVVSSDTTREVVA
jgi:hypothetical protein